MKINDLPNGAIVWYEDLICGIKGDTLEERYGAAILDASAQKIGMNPYDWKLNFFSLPDRLK